MDYPIHIDTSGMDLSILYFKGLPLNISIKYVFLFPKIGFILANSPDPNEMLPYVEFRLCLQCLTKYWTRCNLQVSRMKGGQYAICSESSVFQPYFELLRFK